jgi:hypothetical protein
VHPRDGDAPVLALVQPLQSGMEHVSLVLRHERVRVLRRQRRTIGLVASSPFVHTSSDPHRETKPRSSPQQEYHRTCMIAFWLAPRSRQKHSAAASLGVVHSYTRLPVSAWMPSANSVATLSVYAMTVGATRGTRVSSRILR